MKLQIEKRQDRAGEGLIGRDYRFLLDGIDISDHLTSMKLIMDAKDLNSCEIQFIPDDIEIDADAITALTALVEKAEDESGG